MCSFFGLSTRGNCLGDRHCLPLHCWDPSIYHTATKTSVCWKKGLTFWASMCQTNPERGSSVPMSPACWVGDGHVLLAQPPLLDPGEMSWDQQEPPLRSVGPVHFPLCTPWSSAGNGFPPLDPLQGLHSAWTRCFQLPQGPIIIEYTLLGDNHSCLTCSVLATSLDKYLKVSVAKQNELKCVLWKEAGSPWWSKTRLSSCRIITSPMLKITVHSNQCKENAYLGSKQVREKNEEAVLSHAHSNNATWHMLETGGRSYKGAVTLNSPLL